MRQEVLRLSFHFIMIATIDVKFNKENKNKCNNLECRTNVPVTSTGEKQHRRKRAETNQCKSMVFL